MGIEDADGNKKQEEGKVQDGEHSGNTRRGRNNRGNYRGNDNGNDRGGRIYRNRGGNDEAPPVKKAEFVHKTEDRYANDAAIEVIEDDDGNKKQEEGKVQDGEHSGNPRRGRNNRNRGGNDEEGGDRGNYRGNRGNNQRRERRP